MPKTVKGKATIAKESGMIQRIKETPTGGKEVYIGNTKHFVPAKRSLKVEKGDFIRKGQPICEGVIKPQELLEVDGLDAVRDYMTDELYETYGGSVDEATLETAVKKVTNLTKVEDPGDSDFLPGQYAPLNQVEAVNKKGFDRVPIKRALNHRLAKRFKGYAEGTVLTKKKIEELERKGVRKVPIKCDKIKHRPELKGINQLPLTNDDWLAKMNFNNIPNQFLESASTAAKSKYKDTTSPIPAYVHGEDFGESDDFY